MSRGILPKLLQLARTRVVARIRGVTPPPLPRDADLRVELGVFVTLWLRGELRGCIGLLEPDGPVAEATARMADEALLDPRFTGERVSMADLPDLRLEVTLLGPLHPVAAPHEIHIGRDGVLLEVGGRSGCFLPKVAAERGWTTEETLAQLCRHKLGLPDGAWRLPGARLSTFTAESLVEDAPQTP